MITKIINRFLKWWRGPEKTIEQINDEIEDKIMQEVLSRAFTSGNIIIANRRDDGTVEIEEITTEEKS